MPLVFDQGFRLVVRLISQFSGFISSLPVVDFMLLKFNDIHQFLDLELRGLVLIKLTRIEGALEASLAFLECLGLIFYSYVLWRLIF